jgi:two-component system sensor kinase FixL
MVVVAPTREVVAVRVVATERSATRLGPGDFELGALFERGLDAVVVGDLDSGQIVLWNPAAERLFGHSAAEAIGQPIEILMDAGIGGVHHAGMERYRHTGHGMIVDAGRPVEVPAVTRSGESIRIELTLGPIACTRPGRYVLGVMRDVTDRKRVELLQFELARVNHARDEAEAAVASRDAVLTGAVASDGSGERLRRLARALVDLKLLNNGQLKLHVEETDVGLIVRQAVLAARQRARQHRLVLRGPSCLMASCDAVRVGEVVGELLDNAVVHNPEGCLVDVCVRRPRRGVLELSVRDHGVGVPVEGRERLFEPYYRATQGSAAAGAGLGLHLSRRLVELHGGSLQAVFPPTGGMNLVATLPLPG